MDVVEVDGPLFVVDMARRMVFWADWSFALTAKCWHGTVWGFNEVDVGNRAARELINDKQRLSIGSPVPTPFRTMHATNHAGMTHEKVQQRLDHGRTHSGFCMEFYEVQLREGRFLFHGHPQVASSWQEDCVRRSMERAGVQRVIGHQCVYGLKGSGGNRFGFVRTSIGVMTGSQCVANVLG